MSLEVREVPHSTLLLDRENGQADDRACEVESGCLDENISDSDEDYGDRY
jgi:hypothetical protein